EDLSKLIDCRYISMDLRGHGETQTMDDLDLSIETLTKDVLGVLTYLFSATNTNIILVGHSMGGGVAAHVAEEGVSQSIDFIKGIILVDVVEGTAIDALSGMQSYLRSRPKSFDSVTKAIEWRCYILFIKTHSSINSHEQDLFILSDGSHFTLDFLCILRFIMARPWYLRNWQ
ncbi:unnamed protein product, partial [Gordionus sp. m RMFG-2023]